MSDAENNPYRPPPAAEPDGVVFADRSQRPGGRPLEEFPLAMGREGVKWQLAIYDDRLVFDRGEGHPLVLITRRGLVDQCDLVLGSFVRAITVRGSERLVVPLTPGALRGVRRWIEPVVDDAMAAFLAKRVRSSLPIGLIVVLTSLPILLPRTDVLGLAWGLGMVALALVARVVKHRAVLVADGIVWLLLVARNVPMVIRGGSWLSVFFAALAVMFAFGSFGAFRFFRRATEGRQQ